VNTFLKQRPAEVLQQFKNFTKKDNPYNQIKNGEPFAFQQRRKTSHQNATMFSNELLL